MTGTDTFTISLTPEQLYVLAGAMQLHGLVGFEDPFLGLLADEVEEAMSKALHDLEEQELVRTDNDGGLAIDASLGACVQAAAGAERTIVLSYQHATHDPMVSLVHVAGRVLLEQHNAPDGLVVLTAFRDATVLEGRLGDLLNVLATPAAPGGAVIVTQPDLETGQRTAEERGAEASAEFWCGKGVPPDVAQALAVATQQGSLAVLRRSATQADYGATLAWLAGTRGAWRMEPLPGSDPPAARLIPAATDDIVREIRLVIWQQLPKEA